ncbi:hypothetical protein [Dyadobacter sp. MSC1_007]|jgi:hypothetical protein|uniref:hypothetical protein n=1 Tax=Dyadobacter sp. MSC1_007 TaxID=2909264 RepID=UPI002030A9B6|nr:hypothetical protein [Dyadobacter sp. MSC1_007]
MAFTFRFLIFVVIISTGSVFAQSTSDTQKEPDNTGKSYKYDISLDLYQLFLNGKANVMYRYGSWEKGAFRVQLGASNWGRRENNSSKFDTIPDPSGSKFIYKSGYIDFKVGYEFHKSINKHQIFYGSDIGYSHYFANNNQINNGVLRNNTISLSPFFGLKYRILPRLSASIELALSLDYYVQRAFSHQDVQLSEDKQLSVSFIPLRFLNVSYHF